MLYGALQTVGRRVRLHYAPPLADGEQVTARAVVLATGVTYRQLDTRGLPA